jgi:large subunit ribosomal protein L17
MRHRVRGRKLGRTSSHRKAMFRNMAASLIRSVRAEPEVEGAPKVPGRIITTLAKAKELRPFVERLVTIARTAAEVEQRASELGTSAARNSDEWKSWRDSERWNEWNQAIAPAVAARRRVFALLRDTEAVDILFDELAERFSDRPGGYTRVIRLAQVRLGDGGPKALIEFVGERDRARRTRRTAPVVADTQPAPAASSERED